MDSKDKQDLQDWTDQLFGAVRHDSVDPYVAFARAYGSAPLAFDELRPFYMQRLNHYNSLLVEHLDGAPIELDEDYNLAPGYQDRLTELCRAFGKFWSAGPEYANQ